jgi:hypothetical protein
MDASVVVRLCEKILEELPTEAGVTPHGDLLVGLMLALAMLSVVIVGFFMWF